MKKVLAVFLITINFNLYAEATPTEFFFQADEGQHFFGTGYVYTSLKEDRESTSTGTAVPYDEDEVNHQLFFQYGYGFSEHYALESQLSYSTGSKEINVPSVPTSNRETDYKGLEDIELQLKGRHWDHFYYGLLVSLSLDDSKLTNNGDKENNFTGGHSVGFYVGYEFEVLSGYLGLKAQVRFTLDGTIVVGNQNTEYERSGVHRYYLFLFYEKPYDSWRWGIDLNYFHRGNGDLKAKTSTTTSSIESRKEITLRPYFRLDIGESFSLLPSLAYRIIDENPSGNIKLIDAHEIEAKMALRYHF